MEKEMLYKTLNAQLSALLENEHNMIANMANASALLYQTLPDINWAGFYLYENEELILGPFQGHVACMHIAKGKGVCGSALQQKKTLVVEDVHRFPGHIACDSASKSEIVIPFVHDSQIFGVLDIDAPITHRFDDIDAFYLEKFAQILLHTFI